MRTDEKIFDRQSEINRKNAVFWDEACGSTLARSLGIKDLSADSLRLFDRAYFDFYPYLLKYAKLDRMAGKKVLEVGLGYGSLGQKIAAAGADYLGLDIAEGPVDLMNYRLRTFSLPGRATIGNILESGLESNSFDFVVSIGCFHHTGNMQRCFDETRRLLKPGGTAIVMVYNKFSLRQWIKWPLGTFASFLNDFGQSMKERGIAGEKRKVYDSNTRGEGAPETIFSSIRQLRAMLKRYSLASFNKENCDILSRSVFLRKLTLPVIGKILGFNIYIEAQK